MDKVLKENEKQICQRCEDFRGENEVFGEGVCGGCARVDGGGIGGVESEHDAALLRSAAAADRGVGEAGGGADGWGSGGGRKVTLGPAACAANAGGERAEKRP